MDPLGAATAARDDSFTLDEALLARRKAAGARRLQTVQIPALRAAGFVILCVILVLQGAPAEESAQAELRRLIAINLSYAILAWVVAQRGYERTGRIDCGLLLLHLDIVVWLANLHYLERGQLFFAYLLLVRVVDQVGVGFRRALYFDHVLAAAYLGYSACVASFEPARSFWPERLSIATGMYLLGLYFAATGLVTERLRNRTRRAVRTGRALVQSLGHKTVALEAQAAELETARQQAEQSSLAKSQFLAVTSHEIRTPMNGILGTMELLMGTPLTSAQTRYVQTAHRSAVALLALIDDVLDLSRIEAGKLTLSPTSVDLRALATEAVELVAITARDKPIALTCHVTTTLPSRIVADPLRARQLLVNLLHNAVKFTERGSVRLEVTTDDDAEGMHLRLAVRDTGIGIAADQLDSIFGAFTQVDGSSTRRHGGSGLGLAIVKEVSELMGGNVRVESRLGEGSLFTVDLPLVEAPDAEPFVEPLQADTDEVSVSVLLAEDDLVNQMVVEEMLKMLGCDVEVVGDGAAAWRTATRNDYDIVFMDCHMPVMDGYQAARLIREDEIGRDSHKPIVALTADALAADHERCLEAGMDDFLTKPVSSLQLSMAIERWTGRKTQPATRW